MTKIKFLNIPIELKQKEELIISQVKMFYESFQLLEKDTLHVLIDSRTNAFYCECHISAKDLIEFGTIDVPLDPDLQPDYRANRDVQSEHSAFQAMVEDAILKRTFSNIVCEYNTHYQSAKPIKIIGGQHRYLAIENALTNNRINENHGIKIYFELDKAQRLDVQLISNTNIAVSTDLLDRMFETAKGPELRAWAQKVGLLTPGVDFSDKKQRGSHISVRGARTFIINYYRGKQIDDKNFDKIETIPMIAKTGMIDEEWENLRLKKEIWGDKELEAAGREFAKLHKAQSDFFQKNRKEMEFAEKALSYSVLSAWSFIAGVLIKNRIRLKRHYELALILSSDPLEASLLSKAKHKTDPDNYRGLGTRTDIKDRGRMAELFYLQAEKGGGLNKSLIDLAIKKYHAKLSQLEVLEAEQKLKK